MADGDKEINYNKAQPQRPGLVISTIAIVTLFALDQLSKHAILYWLNLPQVDTIALLPFLNFTYVENRGVSMGFALANYIGQVGLLILTAAISIAMLVWLVRTNRKWEAWGLIAIFAGAVGNIVDRLRFGAVIDFIHLHAFGYSFYIFNIADSLITLGVIALLWDSMFASNKDDKAHQSL